jgi:tyrosine decarboxylase/aspartate 1-decarboxylase
LNELPEKGLPKNLVLEELRNRLQKDLTYNSGKILGSMCAYPHPFASSVFAEFSEKNLGDPGLFPETAEVEREAIGMMGSLFSHPEAVGHIVSGGTEANILAMWAARNLFDKRRREIVAPVSAHSSIEKAADLLNSKLVKVKLDSNFRMDLDEAKRKISNETCVIVGVAGTTGLGVIDPIKELSEIAQTNSIPLHVDAAFGGFVIPFLKELGYNLPDFDFRLPGVSSLTADPHKMGLAPIPAGGILFREEKNRKAIAKRVTYLAGGEIQQTTLLGTRPGASGLAVWALMKHLGKEGYRNVVKRCMRLTMKLTEGIEEIEGLSLPTRPIINIVGIKTDDLRIELLAEELRKQGWAIALFPGYIRIVVMPHIKSVHIEAFLKDLASTVKKLRGRKGI